MTRHRKPPLSTLEAIAVFWDLVRFPDMQVKAAAMLAILFCVVYAMGLGGIVLWLWRFASSFTGGVSFPDSLAPWARIAVGVAWTAFFSVVFMTPLLRNFLPRPSRREPLNKHGVRQSDVNEVIRASEELLARIRSG